MEKAYPFKSIFQSGRSRLILKHLGQDKAPFPGNRTMKHKM